MRKWVVLLLVLILVLASGTIMFSAKFVSSTATIPKIGAYYYPWYTGNWERDHSNTVDTPVLGKYNSSDVNVIRQHLSWFKELKIDFLIISWWGTDSLSDINTKILFDEVKKNPVVNLCILIESYPTTGDYDYAKIYNYIHDTYVAPFPEEYMNLEGKPLIMFYNDQSLTKDGNVSEIRIDNRFAVRVTGQRNYVDWLYWWIPECEWSEEHSRFGSDGQISIVPRYEDEHFRPYNSTSGAGYPPAYDHDYTQGLYDEQWQTAINSAKEGKVKIVTIATWNEYAERTQIEPTNDTTSFTSSPYYLYERTRMYIDIMRSTETEPAPFPMTWVAAVAVSVAVAEACLLVYFIKRKKQITKT